MRKRMKTEQIIVIGVALIGVLIATYWEASCGVFSKKKEITQEVLAIGKERPPLWIFYNDGQVNSRFWSDFGARSSRVLNIPLLNILYETIVKANGDDYRIEVIGGIQGVAELLGYDALPRRLQNFKATVGVAEEDWIRTAVLANFGGLWVSPSVVCVKGFGSLPDDKLVLFGQDDVPMYGTSVPGFRVMWAPSPKNPYLIEWESRIRDRLESQLGGLQIRGDAKSDWVELCKEKDDIEWRPYDELSRDPKTQKKIQLEDLFAKTIHGAVPFEIPECSKYIVVPYNDLVTRTSYGWVLQSSEEHLLTSDLALTCIVKDVLEI